MRQMYKVIVRNLVKPGLFLEWDMRGESEFATLKGAATRRAIAARKYQAYDTAILTPSGDHMIHLTPALRPDLAVAKAVFPKKRKLTPRNPRYTK